MVWTRGCELQSQKVRRGRERMKEMDRGMGERERMKEIDRGRVREGKGETERQSQRDRDRVT